MKRVLWAGIAGIALLLPTGCQRDAAVPTERDNRRLDSASNLLDQAPNALETVDERLPDTGANENGPPAEANSP